MTYGAKLIRKPVAVVATTFVSGAKPVSDIAWRRLGFLLMCLSALSVTALAVAALDAVR